MRDSKLTRGAFAVAGLAVAVGGGVLAWALPAASAGPVEVVEEVGLLRLHLSNAGSSVTYTGPLDVPASQVISIDAKCGATTNGSLLAFTPSAGGIGIVSNGMGVRTRNSCATAQGQIGPDQSLTIALGSAFDADVRVDVAELDVEAKHGADLGIARDGGPAATIPLNNAPDNAPDSGVNDNNRVIVTDDFTSATLTAVGGEIAVEGGGDGTYAAYLDAGLVGPIGQSLPSADSVFRLVRTRQFEHAVDCEESVQATVLGGSATSATFDRQLNDGAQSPDDCDDIGVTLEILDEGVSLLKSIVGIVTGQPEAVNSQLTIVWAPIAPPVPVPLPARQIDFDGLEGDTFDFEPVQWCIGIDPETGPIHPADARFDDGLLPWCLVSDIQTLQADGSVVQTQLYDGKGDPFWK